MLLWKLENTFRQNITAISYVLYKLESDFLEKGDNIQFFLLESLSKIVLPTEIVSDTYTF